MKRVKRSGKGRVMRRATLWGEGGCGNRQRLNELVDEWALDLLITEKGEVKWREREDKAVKGERWEVGSISALLLQHAYFPFFFLSSVRHLHTSIVLSAGEWHMESGNLSPTTRQDHRLHQSSNNTPNFPSRANDRACKGLLPAQTSSP